MGAKQSRRSVDITTTPKKGEIESPIEGEGKVEKISDLEAKIATNGSIHNEIEYADKEETEREEAEAAAIKENGVSDSEGSKTPDADVSTGDQLNESSDVAEKSADSLEKSDETNENNKKNKEKSKKRKWSLRALSFSKKDKSKPGKDEKNGDVKELNEESAEQHVATPTSPEEIKANEAVSPSLPEPEAVQVANGEVDNAKPSTEMPPESEIEESKPVSLELKPSEAKPIELPVAKEEIKVEEPKAQGEVETAQPKQEESTGIKVDENVVAESKEVRNEEVPPPLPSSNPPSPVTVFAESTMADSPPTEHVPVAQSTTVPVVESTVVPLSSASHPDDTPEMLPAPSVAGDVENISSKGDCLAPVEGAESIISSPPVVEQIISELPQTNPVIETPLVIVPDPILELQPVTESPNVSGQELLAEPAPSPFLDSSLHVQDVEPSSPNKEPESVPLPTPIEQVINTDSLPDISTESLPSLPEPLSESLPEPMSLPPVDCIPEPIAPEANSLTEPEPLPNIPIERDSIADIPLPSSEAILTNGDAHGSPSPVVDDTSLTAMHEGPVKQVIATSEVSEVTDEKRHDTNEVEASSVSTTVEE